MHETILQCRDEFESTLFLRHGSINNMTTLAAMPDLLEQEAKDFLQRCLVQHASLFFGGAQPDVRFIDYIVDNRKHRYTVSFMPDINRRGKLTCFIYESFPDVPETISGSAGFLTAEFSIKGNGAHDVLTFSITDKLAPINWHHCEDITTSIFGTAYNWFKIQIEKFARSSAACVADRLYEHLRLVVRDDALFNQLWIAVVGRGYGFRLVNPEQASQLFATFAANESFGLSTDYLVGNLVSTRLPYEDLLMKKASDEGVTIDGDITSARYTQRGNVYSITMHALYDGDAFSIFPLYRDELSLVALYPVETKDAIEPILEKNKHSIGAVARPEMRKIALAFLLFDNQNEGNGTADGDDASVTSAESQLIEDAINTLLECFCHLERHSTELLLEKLAEQEGAGKLAYDPFLLSTLLKELDNGRHASGKGEIAMKTTTTNDGMLINQNIGNVFYGNVGSYAQGEASTAVSVNGINPDVAEILHSIQNSPLVDPGDKDYVDAQIKLLERELQKRQPSKNTIDRVLQGLGLIDGIASLADMLKNALGL